MMRLKGTIAKWETGEPDDIVLKVREAQIKQLYKQTWIGLSGGIVITLLVSIPLWQVIPQWKLLLWVGILLLLTAARGFLSAAFQRKAPAGPAIYRWASLHVIGTIASGMMWAVPSLFLWPGNSYVHQLIWPICIVAISASAVASYCTWTPAYMSFLFLTVVPISLRLLSEGGLVHVVLGLLGLFFIAVLARTGMVMHEASLRALLEGFHNEALNIQLQQEVAERTRSQEELRLQNQELEQLNTQLSKTKDNLESANKKLEYALTNVKQLSGLLPICASCKKIRNDKGYWEQIEGYVRNHSEAQFSHGICPGCAKKLYPEIFKKQ